MLGLFILSSRFNAIQGLFGKGNSHFEPRSDDENDTELALPSPNLRTTPVRVRLSQEVKLNWHQALKHGGFSAKSSFDPGTAGNS
ncbi:hypothetical protein AVEN_212596-1 [Araneus ventricosus]|uniref:Uncharacterized protein n=1 Tax=Araneus ventricosus TaxID=182803 RepID=A0A4Y2VU22_ARAVE|nr:hypothetical protein AVEN_212596-1 [Araneus ventricosus]